VLNAFRHHWNRHERILARLTIVVVQSVHLLFPRLVKSSKYTQTDGEPALFSRNAKQKAPVKTPELHRRRYNRVWTR
jgi:hypothetical protein